LGNENDEFQRLRWVDIYLNNSEIQGNLKVTTFLKPKESWWNYDFYPEIPYIVAHYLKLNLTFVEPTLWDFNIHNQTRLDEFGLKLCVKNHFFGSQSDTD